MGYYRNRKWISEKKYNRMQELWRHSKKFRIRKKNYTRLNKPMTIYKYE